MLYFLSHYTFTGNVEDIWRELTMTSWVKQITKITLLTLFPVSGLSGTKEKNANVYSHFGDISRFIYVLLHTIKTSRSSSSSSIQNTGAWAWVCAGVLIGLEATSRTVQGRFTLHESNTVVVLWLPTRPSMNFTKHWLQVYNRLYGTMGNVSHFYSANYATRTNLLTAMGSLRYSWVGIPYKTLKPKTISRQSLQTSWRQFQ